LTFKGNQTTRKNGLKFGKNWYNHAQARMVFVRNIPMANTLTISYPESLPDALRMSRREFEREARLLLAASLFGEKKLTSGQAAGMAGLSRSEFLLKTGAMGLAAAMPAPEEIAGDAGE
jgi:hypothetical protein